MKFQENLLTRLKKVRNKNTVEVEQNKVESMKISPLEMNKNVVPAVRTMLVLSDITISLIPAWQLKENIDLGAENVITKLHTGSTADKISFFSKNTLNDTQRDQVIIIAGTNDISKRLRDKALNENKMIYEILVGVPKYLYLITCVNNLLERMLRGRFCVSRQL